MKNGDGQPIKKGLWFQYDDDANDGCIQADWGK
jgi:hypothetical protein